MVENHYLSQSPLFGPVMTPSSRVTVSVVLLYPWLSIPVATQLPPADVVHVPLTASSDNQRYFAHVNMVRSSMALPVIPLSL